MGISRGSIAATSSDDEEMNIFTALKLWMKLQPIIKREQALMTMKLSTSTVCQLLLGLGDVINVVTPLLKGDSKVIAGTVLAILHVVVNTIAHISNPDGTPAVSTDKGE